MWPSTERQAKVAIVLVVLLMVAFGAVVVWFGG